MSRAPYDRIANEFSAARAKLLPADRKYLDLVLAPLAPRSTVLDLGCGTGTPIAAEVIALGHGVVGIDASPALLTIARERFPGHRWIHARMEDVALDGPFDGAICWDAMFHVPRDLHAGIIGKIARALRPGGRLMITSGGVVGDTGFTDTMFGHEFFYDSLPPSEMTPTLEAAGFDIVVAEMCNPPDGGRDRGRWATVAAKRPEA